MAKKRHLLVLMGLIAGASYYGCELIDLGLINYKYGKQIVRDERKLIEDDNYIYRLTTSNGLIDIPVMQYENNQYYLSHDMDGNQSRMGWIFLDSNDSYESEVVHIYGHHVYYDENKMFSPLMKYKDGIVGESFKLGKNNYDIKLVMSIDKNDINMLNVDMISKLDEKKMIDNAIVLEEFNLSDCSQVVFLRTCEDDDHYLVVCGVL